MDGNFHHCHLVSGGQGIPFHQPKYIIPKGFVDQVGEHISEARKLPAKLRKSQVPNEAVDECQSSYDAANGDKKKASTDGPRYDAQGWMSLICRHDIPLFFANIDTPGEQQKYAVALIQWFFQFVPASATVTVLYDVGCVLHRSVKLVSADFLFLSGTYLLITNQKYGILPGSIASRIQFVTTAMHVYGHQWACQLAYNPRLCKGLGLTDGEGVERTWSKL